MPRGQNGQSDISNNAGGGAGGSSAGWIRIRSLEPASVDVGAIVTPAATID